MPNDIEDGTVNMQSALGVDEALLAEFGQKETDSRPGRADQIGQCFLADLRNDGFSLASFPKAGQQHKNPGQPFLAAVEALIQQVLLDSDVAGQQIGDEKFREAGLFMQHAVHGVFLYPNDRGVFHADGRLPANLLDAQAGFAEKPLGPQNRDDGLFAGFRDHAELDLALDDMEHGDRRIPLRIDPLFLSGVQNRFSSDDRCEQGLGIERNGSVVWHRRGSLPSLYYIVSIYCTPVPSIRLVKYTDSSKPESIAPASFYRMM